MTDLVYALAIAFAIATFIFTTWVTAEGFIPWNVCLGIIVVLVAAVIAINWSWLAEKKEKDVY